MKKLSLKNLDLSACEMLQKEQLKSVFGGYGGYGGSNGGICKITIFQGGFKTVYNAYFNGSSSEQSSAANAHCLDNLTNWGADKCYYDCAHDGYGQ